MDQYELLFDPRHLGVPFGVSKTISEPMARSSKTVQLSRVEINTISKRTEASFHLTHITLGVPSGAPKMFSKPIARSAQTVHLFYVENSTISKETETSFHLTHVT
jgi:hypothetical protein